MEFLGQDQIECGLKEDRHLRAIDRCGRAVVPAAAAARDAFGGQLLDPGGEGIIGWHIREGASRSGWGVTRAVLGDQQEDGHLLAGDGGIGTVVAPAAAARDAFSRELLDPLAEHVVSRDIVEDGASGIGWGVG